MALNSYTGLRRWLLVRGSVLLAAFAVLYVINGFVIGWKTTYDVTVGITSPGAHGISAPILAWPLSIAGWLAAPAVFGAIAGVVVSAAITGRRTLPIHEILAKDQPR